MQEKGYFPDYELMYVRYDKKENIWILTFWENKINYLGSDFNVAINGENSEIIRMWVME
jgi:hypothetical protein